MKKTRILIISTLSITIFMVFYFNLLYKPKISIYDVVGRCRKEDMFEYGMGQAYHIIHTYNIDIEDYGEFFFFNSGELPDRLPVYFSDVSTMEADHRGLIQNITNNAEKMKLAIETSDDELYNNVIISSNITTNSFKLYITTEYDTRGYYTSYRTRKPFKASDSVFPLGEEIIISKSDNVVAVNKKIEPVMSFFNELLGTDFTLNNDYLLLSDRFARFTAYYETNKPNDKIYTYYFNNFKFLFKYLNDEHLALESCLNFDYHFDKSINYDLIKLEQAEEYLYKDYMLMGGVGLTHLSEQEPVDFSDYDMFTVAYSQSMVSEIAIPYYVFFKKIDDSKYAAAYVPAIEIYDIDEFFVKIKK